MSHSQYERVSVFSEATMAESDPPKPTPKLTPRSSYSVVYDEKHAQKLPTFNYKPPVLRSAPLLSLLAITLALIGCLEYAIRQLPHGSIKLKRRDEILRQSTEDSFSLVHGRSANISSSSASYLAYTTGSAYVDDDSLSSMAYTTAATSAYVDGVSTSSSALNEYIVSAIQASTAYIDAASISSSAPGTPHLSNGVPTGLIMTANPSAYLSDLSFSSSSVTVAMATPTSAYVPGVVATTVVTRHLLVQPTLQPGSASAAPSAYVSAYVFPVPTDGGNRGDHKPGSDNKGSGVDDGYDDSSFDDQHASVKGVRVVVWDAQRVFLSTYLAVCVAVIYRLLWVILYNAFNLIEPFRQLMDRDGALAEHTFFAFYQNQSNLVGPLPALRRRRWALALLGTAFMIVNLLPALASESIYAETKWDCPNPNLKDTNNPCNPRIMANVTMLRIMQGFLGFAALVLLFTTSLLLFRKTGLPAKPNSIATVASLMRHPRLLADFCELPTNASTEHMEKMMAGKRYRMGYYVCANGLGGYGIQPWNGYDSDGFVSPFGTFKHQYTPLDSSTSFSNDRGSKPRRFQVRDGILVFSLLGAFGVVLAYYLDGNDDPFNRFFNSNTFGPRFVLTLAGTVVANMWKSVAQDAIVTAPYTRLATRPTSPGSTILLTPTSDPLISTLRMLRHRYPLAASITLLALAAEALNVVISGIPYANGQQRIQFFISTYISLATLGVMILVFGLALAWRALREPRVPRRPATLGAVMSFLCASRMLDDFEGVEGLSARERERRMRLWGKKYEFSETVRRDGKLGWTVDEAFHRPHY